MVWDMTSWVYNVQMQIETQGNNRRIEWKLN